jgi:pyruvate/2-oxoglutarate dehydrogenase complex dihydrolipoamide acyltransferase (E2) component
MPYLMSTRRKLAIATWDSPREGNIYGKLEVDATEALAYIEHVRATSGEKVGITHFVGKCVGQALAKSPGLNGKIFMGSYSPHTSVNLAFLVALEEGADLGKAKVDNIDQKSVADIGRELRELAGRLRGGKDPDFEKSKGTIRLMPTWLLSPLLWLTGWLSASAGVRLKALGVEPFPFGSCIVTSVGMFGLDEGYAPPTPFARVPVYVLIGALRDRVVVVDGQMVIRPMLTITATIDHRYMDGHEGGRLAHTVRGLFENPWQLEGLQGRPSSAASEAG